MILQKPIFYLLFIICLNTYGQTTKWQHLVRKNAEGKYFLVKTSDNGEIPEGYKVVRVLDREYVITRPPEHAAGETQNREKNERWPANDLWKISPNTDLSRTGNATFIIKASGDECLEDVKKNGMLLSPMNNRGYFAIRTTAGKIAKYILPLDCVTYIGMESLTPMTESSIPDLNLSVNNITQLHREAPDLMGQGMVVSIKDDMYDREDIDLLNKHMPSENESSEVSRHATDMATLATGLGNSSANGKGVAPEARISSSDFNMLHPDDDLDALGVSVQNHSYGTEIENFYGMLAREYDTFLYENPAQVHLFSSGNLGHETSQSGPYSGISGYANLTGNFKMTKNTLTVGALDTRLSVPDFSSKGPAHDGRIKPDLAAFSSIGTSNANALVSGITLLLQQYYRGEHNDSLPPSSLVKALLINGADDLGGPGPDFRSGYGNVNALESRNTLFNGQFITGGVENAGIREYTLEIPEDAINIKVTLNWTDLPAEPNSNIALVNDLDMTVSHNGVVYEPWILDHSASEQALNKPAARGTDHLNNTEQILVPEVAGNTFTIRVEGYKVAGGEQPFSIAYSWEREGEFYWINPVENGNFPYDGASADLIRWKSTFRNLPGTLHASYDEGRTWQTIATDVILEEGYLSWDPAENEGSTALLKMAIGDRSFISPSFVISYTLHPRISLKCHGTTEFSWQKNTTAVAYDVFSLENNALTFTERITDTTYVANSPSPYFAVAPVYGNGTKGIRSQALDVSGSGEQCYWESAYATNEEERIRLYFSLGSTYLAESIEVFKIFPEGEERIQSIGPVSQKEFEVIDNTPLEGANVYRARLTLEDGTELYSETINTIYLSATPFLLFPNPVTSGGLNIYSKKFRSDDTVYIYLFSVDGKFMMKEQLISDRDFMALERLTNGVYYYKIEVNGKKMKSGGLILHRF